jgi:hypothetical protein
MKLINIIISFVLGSLIKIYDEIIDNNIKIKKSIINIIKISIIILYTYIGFNYPLVIVYTFFLFVASYLCTSKIFKSTSKDGGEIKEMDDIYWSQLFYYTVFLMVILFFKFKNKIITNNIFSDYKLIIFFIVVIATVTMILIEFYMVTEEYSKDKLNIRFLFVISCILLLYSSIW